MGFVMVETQLNISKKYKEFDFEDRLVKHLFPRIDIDIVKTREELNGVLDRITSDMFSTDRVYLDPHFDSYRSMIRYKNWINTEFGNGNSIIKRIIYNEEEVGFGMHREMDGVLYGLLGGIYKNHQSEGLGLLTAGFDFLMAKKQNRPFNEVRTAISSNNIPMLKFYNYLNFRVDKMTYVFVKHNNLHI
jgi:hypothetical protein